MLDVVYMRSLIPTVQYCTLKTWLRMCSVLPGQHMHIRRVVSALQAFNFKFSLMREWEMWTALMRPLNCILPSSLKIYFGENTDLRKHWSSCLQSWLIYFICTCRSIIQSLHRYSLSYWLVVVFLWLPWWRTPAWRFTCCVCVVYCLCVHFGSSNYSTSKSKRYHSV